MLERIITRLLHNDIKNVNLFLFEKSQYPGAGCHSPELPEDILTNTIACQMTMYFGKSMARFGPIYEGPSLFEWARRNYSNDSVATDYLPRRVLGQYLLDFFLEQKTRMEAHNIKFRQIFEEVVDVICHSNHVKVSTSTKSYEVTKCVLTTGHQQSWHQGTSTYDEFVDYDVLEEIDAPNNIAIQGMGLTAFDAISRLTEGRGGIFNEVEENKLEYIPCGHEPKMFLYSRSGVFTSGRAVNPSPEYIYVPKFFTALAIENIKSKQSAVDFEKDYLPLLNEELTYAFSLIEDRSNLDLDRIYQPELMIGHESQKQFVTTFLEYLRWDIEQCILGKMRSAHKFCQEAIRDLRDQFRLIVEFQNLNPDSHACFLAKWHPLITRACVGPPVARLKKLEALIAAQVCSVDFALNPNVRKFDDHYELTCEFGDEKRVVCVDQIVKARIPSISFSDTQNPLVQNLMKRYEVSEMNGRQFGGLKITRTHNVKDKSRHCCANLYALGIPTEGERYFTLVLGRPSMVSTFLLDSDRVAKCILEELSPCSKIKGSVGKHRR